MTAPAEVGEATATAVEAAVAWAATAVGCTAAVVEVADRVAAIRVEAEAISPETAEGVGDRDAYWFAGSIARTDGSAARRSSVSRGIHPTIES